LQTKNRKQKNHSIPIEEKWRTNLAGKCDLVEKRKKKLGPLEPLREIRGFKTYRGTEEDAGRWDIPGKSDHRRIEKEKGQKKKAEKIGASQGVNLLQAGQGNASTNTEKGKKGTTKRKKSFGGQERRRSSQEAQEANTNCIKRKAQKERTAKKKKASSPVKTFKTNKLKDI